MLSTCVIELAARKALFDAAEKGPTYMDGKTSVAASFFPFSALLEGIGEISSWMLDFRKRLKVPR